MKSNRHTAITFITFFTILLLLITSCKGAMVPTPATPVSSAETNLKTSGLSPDAFATLDSLVKLDEYPFYVMHYSGEYEYPQVSSSVVGEADFGCSLFAALGEAGDKIYGRNFDWDFSPALLVFTDPPDGYASASMVDLTFLGVSQAESGTLTDLPVHKREALLAAPSMPFDGMNEYGLAVGMAALPGEYLDDVSYDSYRPSIGSIGIIRQVLDHARDVDEALELFGQYNITFSGGPPIHYLLADPSGSAMLVEFYQGEMIQLPNESPWHLATNHLRCTAEGDGGCWRYRILSDRLTRLDGQLDAEAALQLLLEVKQDVTQWSAVYDMTSGDIQVVIGQQYDSPFSFHLDRKNP